MKVIELFSIISENEIIASKELGIDTETEACTIKNEEEKKLTVLQTLFSEVPYLGSTSSSLKIWLIKIWSFLGIVKIKTGPQIEIKTGPQIMKVYCKMIRHLIHVLQPLLLSW